VREAANDGPLLLLDALDRWGDVAPRDRAVAVVGL